LKAIPWFRSLPKTLWVSSLLTALFVVLWSLAFAALDPPPKSEGGFASRFWVSLVYSGCCGYCIQTLSHVFGPVIRRNFEQSAFAIRLAFTIAMWVGGGLAGYVLAGILLGQRFALDASMIAVIILGNIIVAAVAGVALRRRAIQEVAAERDRAERSETQRALAVSRLRLLQAQIEPHFLFNTLANVSSLIECDPKEARRMLDQFTLLLRASLDQTRKENSPLGAELKVLDAYLSVLKVRMGARLEYSINAASDLMSIEIPTMLLQPIVENAVKHGIEPRVKGGRVSIAVKRDDAYLVLTVADDGVGFMANSTENIGLGAVRERLQVQFGTDASLSAERTADNWTLVTIRIPMPA
jgi:signal transduction histidine kinase